MNDATSTQITPSNSDDAKPYLWNPNVAANWGLLFTPVFGAWVHAKNWNALGHPDKAKKSMLWAYAAIAFTVLLALLPVDSGMAVPQLVFLFVWYFAYGRKQINHVRDELNDEYEKRSWRKPLSWAFGIWGGIMALLFMVGAIAVAFQPIDLDDPDTYVGDYELVAVIFDPRMAMLLDFPLPQDGFRSDRPFEVTVQGHTMRMQVSGAMHLGRESVEADWNLHTSFPGAAYMSDTTETDALSGQYTIQDGVLTVGSGHEESRYPVSAEGQRLSLDIDGGTAIWRRTW